MWLDSGEMKLSGLCWYVGQCLSCVLCQCYQLVVWVLPADSVSVTGWLCQCYWLVMSVLPAGWVSVTSWLHHYYWLVGSVLPPGWVSITSWLCQCYWLVGSVLPAGCVCYQLSLLSCVCVWRWGGVIKVSGTVGNGCDPLKLHCYPQGFMSDP